MAKLKPEDFKYYKSLIDDDIAEHNEKLEDVNKPDQVIDAYKGYFHDYHDANMIENYLFIGANTILPSLFFQLPRVLIRAIRKELDWEAAVLSSYINADFGEEEKLENQNR